MGPQSRQAVRYALAGATLLSIAAALYVSVVVVPPEAVMGVRIRILFVHVGAAWTAYLSYAVTATGAVLYLRYQHARWDRLGVASAELGLVLTSLTLLSGSLWAKSTQGAWWVWEPRLTLTLLLWFLYAAYLIARQYTLGERRAAVSAVLAVAGVATMILNHFAVRLSRIMHPEPVIASPGGPNVEEPSYLLGLALALIAFTLVYALLLDARIALEDERSELEALRQVR